VTKDIITANGIYKSFDKTIALNGVDLRVPTGSILALLGPNGAGKTTIVRILATLLKPDKGEVTINGFNALREPIAVQAMIGLAGQYATVDENLTGVENLRLIGKLYHLRWADANARANELIEQLELKDAAYRAVKTYSGGMRRRLDLAASLIIEPPILFLDEPTTGLDPAGRNKVWEIVRRLVANGTTVLLTTQYLEEADQLADRITILDHGCVIADDTPSVLKSKIGGEQIEITFADSGALLDAKTLLLENKVLNFQNKLQLSLPVEANGVGLKQVAHLLSLLSAANVQVSDYNIHRATLDDVFLQLTQPSAAPCLLTTKEKTQL
jgi:daunorubicin resistance ABC transporter ATP-binding subunit